MQKASELRWIPGYHDPRIKGGQDIRIHEYQDKRISSNQDTRIKGGQDIRIQGYQDNGISSYQDTMAGWPFKSKPILFILSTTDYNLNSMSMVVDAAAVVVIRVDKGGRLWTLNYVHNKN